jgi:hypothetical protein
MYAKQGIDKRIKYQQKQRALGNCIICGQPRTDSPYRSYCRFHGALRRLYDQRRLKRRPWQRGKSGKPPYDVPVVDRDQLERMLGRK